MHFFEAKSSLYSFISILVRNLDVDVKLCMHLYNWSDYWLSRRRRHLEKGGGRKSAPITQQQLHPSPVQLQQMKTFFENLFIYY